MPLAQRVFKRDPMPTLIVIAAMTIAWGIAIALTDAIDLNPTYRFLSSWCADDWIIGLVAALAGSALLVFTLAGIWDAVRVAVITISMAWIALVAAILAGGLPGAAAWTYGVVGVAGLWCYLALGVRKNGHRG